MSDMAERVETLEIRVAHQDRTIEELNATVTRQWTLVEQLQRQMKRLEEQVLSGSFIADPATERPPPHY